jgi:hypothetical protein
MSGARSQSPSAIRISRAGACGEISALRESKRSGSLTQLLINPGMISCQWAPGEEKSRIARARGGEGSHQWAWLAA